MKVHFKRFNPRRERVLLLSSHTTCSHYKQTKKQQGITKQQHKRKTAWLDPTERQWYVLSTTLCVSKDSLSCGVMFLWQSPISCHTLTILFLFIFYSKEGMIWNANHVLEQALSPDTPGVPRNMIKHCKGIILLSVVSTIEMASRISISRIQAQPHLLFFHFNHTLGWGRLCVFWKRGYRCDSCP